MNLRLLFINTIFLMGTLSETLLSTGNTSCLPYIKDTPVHQEFYIMGDKRKTFKIQTTNRIEHKLMSEILKILLEEALGYSNIEIIQMNTTQNYSNILQNLLTTKDIRYPTFPDAMINLNLPLTADVNINDVVLQSFADYGDTSPNGRFGWFVSKEFAKKNTNVEHWRFFQQPDNSHYFDVTDNDWDFLKANMINKYTNRYYCEEPICKDGYYIPKHCDNKKNQAFAVMLTSYPESTDFIISHIENFKLFIKVVWVGDNLHIVADTLTKSYNATGNKKSILFLEWAPGYFTLNMENYMSVALPNCESLQDTESIQCKYEMTRNAKVAWNSLKFNAEDIFNVISKMEFNKEIYTSLLDFHKTNNVHNDIHLSACRWMQNNEYITNNWLKTQKKKIIIGGIIPMKNFYNGQGILEAANLAVEAVNSNHNILTKYELYFINHNDECKTDTAMKLFNDYVFKEEFSNLLGILGPACSETIEPVAGLSKHYSTVSITYSAEGPSFANRLEYPYFFRTIGENQQYKQVYLNIFKHFQWNRIAALTEDGQKYTEYISSMGNLLQEHGITLLNLKFSRDHQQSKVERHLEEIKNKSIKIIIADVKDVIARIVVCKAISLEMTSSKGYVWFLPPWLTPDWYNTTQYNIINHENSNCTAQQMENAINGYFSLNHAYFGKENQIMQENTSIAVWRKKYGKSIYRQLRKDATSLYAGFTYDAVWTYAIAADKLFQEHPEYHFDKHSTKIIQKFAKFIEDTDFFGVSGHVKFHGGSRIPDININQWINGSKFLVGNFHPNISKDDVFGGTLDMNNSGYNTIRWLTSDGAQPDDGSSSMNDCIFEGLAHSWNVTCSTAIIIVNIISFSILGFVLTLALYILKRRYEKKMKRTVEYMQAMGIDGQTIMNMASLDKWETSKENVIINRKIGEGAFGTVYGGEAIIGEGWLPVAVKTLKVGSTTEQKLDFLSEAESMKRFDHKNIVKLLGVCTKSEPVFTIMEFMLYGDLKTYLLARRHLVNGKYQEECEEVSSRKLTNMALDVARALSYLAELKYVHRDIACRNCLINSQRVVKVGDFGMTRLIFENDYYRFSRKGLLPVRWMAPESLGLGIFTPASDVWSYGVLLYEIITFGGFPFQGLSNNQVLEAVKTGDTLTIPKGVKPQLEALIKSCWNKEHKNRPQASEIVEFIANNPRLLAPCLDVPISSVNIEYPNELDILPAVITNTSINKENDSSVINSMRFDNPNYGTEDINSEQMFLRKKYSGTTFLSDNNICEENVPFV